MNNRIDAIRRMAEHDPYWRGYLAGMENAHTQAGEFEEYARLTAAREARRANWDDDWTPIASPNARSTGE